MYFTTARVCAQVGVCAHFPNARQRTHVPHAPLESELRARASGAAAAQLGIRGPKWHSFSQVKMSRLNERIWMTSFASYRWTQVRHLPHVFTKLFTCADSKAVARYVQKKIVQKHTHTHSRTLLKGMCVEMCVEMCAYVQNVDQRQVQEYINSSHSLICLHREK